MKNALEEQNNVKKGINIRNIISYILITILFIALAFKAISYTTLLMLILPITAITMWSNSYFDNDLKKNKKRVLILAVLLTLTSFTAYDGQRLIHKKVDIALEQCYKYSENKLLCKQMHHIVYPIYRPDGKHVFLNNGR